MTPAIFIDTNIPLYVLGTAHELREPCRRVLEAAAERPDSFATDAEVLQEMLYHYTVRKRWTVGRQALQQFAELMEDRIVVVEAGDVLTAAALVDANPGLESRDLVHAAVMRRIGIQRIVSADKAFDRLLGVERLDPARWEFWRESVL